MTSDQAGDVIGHGDPRWHVRRFAGPFDEPRYLSLLEAMNHPCRHRIVRGKPEGLVTVYIGQFTPPVVEACSFDIVTGSVHAYKSPAEAPVIPNTCNRRGVVERATLQPATDDDPGATLSHSPATLPTTGAQIDLATEIHIVTDNSQGFGARWGSGGVVGADCPRVSLDGIGHGKLQFPAELGFAGVPPVPIQCG